ncbi:MAG: hypothetical protein ACRDD7_03730 [Peptostreptococcaceae bacterium]
MNNFNINIHFNLGVAIEVGTDGAIMLSNFQYWITKNMANNKHFHNDKYWTYNTLDAFAKLFPQYSKRQIERILNNLKKDGYIETGNYNKSSYDRTTWYTLTQKYWDLFSNDTNSPISPNGEMEKRKRGNQNHDSVTPIPDNKPDNKLNNTSYSQITEKYNATCTNMRKVIKLSDKRKKLINARLKDSSLEEIFQVIELSSKCEFLNGNNNRNWKANFDWIMNENNFVNILEGKYYTAENTNKKSNQDDELTGFI